MSAFNAALALGAGVILILGLVSGWIKSRLWIAETTICTLIGLALGPAMFGVVTPERFPVDEFVVLKQVARLTLGVAVMAAALHLPERYLRDRAGALFLSIGLGMTLMWLTTGVLVWLIGGGMWLAALAVGAAVCPTDPVIAGSIVNGRLAGQALPEPLRLILTAESGANDGLGLLFVMLPVLLITQPAGEGWRDWFIRVLGWEIAGAVVLGAAIGWFAGLALSWVQRIDRGEHHSMLTIGIALSLTVLAVLSLMGSDGILAVFVAGMSFRWAHTGWEDQLNMQEAVARFFNLPVFLLFGVMAPWQDWVAMGWKALALAGAVLLLRRLPWWLMLKPVMGPVASWRQGAFLGWFGPMGVSSIYYATLINEKTDLNVWPVISLLVFASVIAHGVSATPATRWLGRREPVDEKAG